MLNKLECHKDNEEQKNNSLLKQCQNSTRWMRKWYELVFLKRVHMLNTNLKNHIEDHINCFKNAVLPIECGI